jgi:hypothetical protein
MTFRTSGVLVYENVDVPSRAGALDPRENRKNINPDLGLRAGKLTAALLTDDGSIGF